ncbi:hypothetical protein PoB_001977200 [Plakobranchus ocellatus]|uniref:Uncharacterized protein n=1 Tax=Plakobranchus ocellatus TaxID=259542 RepID=A0AAV3ZFK3_9GAST|nr:hypothetical protein PoB_001977200 [Plakobranchus ocellatus]
MTDNATCFSSAKFRITPRPKGQLRDWYINLSSLSRRQPCLQPTPFRSFSCTTARTPLASGGSPSKLLNLYPIRKEIDTIVAVQRSRRPRDITTSCCSLNEDSPCFALAYKGGR